VIDSNTGRSATQCRERYVNVHTPAITKGTVWTAEEDALLLTVAEQCARKWVDVAKRLPGRSDNMCFKRWKKIAPSELVQQHASSRGRINRGTVVATTTSAASPV